MTFGIPLSDKEKEYIAMFPELSHGDVARSLKRLFKSNEGTRNRMTVYLFRQTEEYRDLRVKVKVGRGELMQS
jgi:hypothetical protein